ncbi:MULTISPECIES: sulfurtransferase complex subunit TusB [Vibrio]|uniref:sulfurtransferase complex subunit TusB n=1 Tax=Vibrio TaxID=662 RepID=UPI0022849E16|nr:MULTISPECIES: sulfurtransferase complex subunit TusB [Vibrio]MCY9855960.1 sulfurtransferase complex subunit TusB [Vibrio mediterranei]MDA0111552.1 sulfurtransferase complex subunit TusB [Vibrio sp. La 4.2.2]
MLHIIKTEIGYQQALRYLSQDDQVILVENACYLITDKNLTLPSACFVLQPDLSARGLMSLVSESTQVVDFNGFVELTERHVNSTTWE